MVVEKRVVDENLNCTRDAGRLERLAAKHNVSKKNIILVGRSVGTGPVCQLAATHEVTCCDGDGALARWS